MVPASPSSLSSPDRSLQETTSPNELSNGEVDDKGSRGLGIAGSQLVASAWFKALVLPVFNPVAHDKNSLKHLATLKAFSKAWRSPYPPLREHTLQVPDIWGLQNPLPASQ